MKTMIFEVDPQELNRVLHLAGMMLERSRDEDNRPDLQRSWDHVNAAFMAAMGATK